MSEIENKILNAATSWSSATAIAQVCGKSKGSQIASDIEKLVANGELEVDSSGRFPLYRRKSAAVPQQQQQQQPQVQQQTCSVDGSLPDGYQASSICVRRTTGQVGRIIQLPSSNKVFVEDGYSLVVINGTPVKCVKTPISAIDVIHKYALDNDMANFTVSQAKTGTIGDTNEITSCGGVIDLTITKNNKAAK